MTPSRTSFSPGRPATGPWPLRTLAASGLLVALKLLTIWGLVALFSGPVRAQELLPVPALAGRVIDQTSTLSPAQRQALEAKLATFEAQAGPQMVVLMVATTQPEDIAAFAQRVGETWKIGRKDVGDGLLLVVAKNDRRLWIAPAKALEGAVPDLAARQIVRDMISPAFKAGDYAGGLDKGVDALMARIRGEGLPEPAGRAPKANAEEGFQAEDLLAFLFVAVPVAGGVLSAMLGRKLGALLTGGAAGGVVWWVTHSLLLGVGAALVALFVPWTLKKLLPLVAWRTPAPWMVALMEASTTIAPSKCSTCHPARARRFRWRWAPSPGRPASCRSARRAQRFRSGSPGRGSIPPARARALPPTSSWPKDSASHSCPGTPTRAASSAIWWATPPTPRVTAA